MSTATLSKIDELKDAGQDYEWYPTTEAMIDAIYNHMPNMLGERHHVDDVPKSIMDIGAGDGRVLIGLRDRIFAKMSAEYTDENRHQKERLATRIASFPLFAIEKAPIHIDAMPSNIAIIGTDFDAQTLIDKPVDTVFCNPPYLKYETWAIRIIRESQANSVYFIMPRRWGYNQGIVDALADRGAPARVIWKGDFKDGDRAARCEVDIVHVQLHDPEYKKEDTAFDMWFNDTFPEIEEINKVEDVSPESQINGDLLTGYNLVDRLTQLYDIAMKEMYDAYRALCSVDPAILKTVGVSVGEVKTGLKSKIKGLKNLYWKELFDNLDKVTSRLTTSSRKAILEKMMASVHVDFTHDNAYAVVMWVLKNANDYIDGQVTDLFVMMSQPKHIHNYKSNQRTWEQDGWRFLNGKDPHTHYTLDYRIITEQRQGIQVDSCSWDYTDGLHNRCHERLQDLITVANNLGFPCSDTSMGREWESNKAQEFKLDNGKVLMQVRAFKNGNIHYKLDQEFIKALNIEASRLLGWIRTPQEAVEELDITMDDAEKHFGANLTFAKNDCLQITGGSD